LQFLPKSWQKAVFRAEIRESHFDFSERSEMKLLKLYNICGVIKAEQMLDCVTING